MNMKEHPGEYVVIEALLHALCTVASKEDNILWATYETNMAALFRELTFFMEEHCIETARLPTCAWYEHSVYMEAKGYYEQQLKLQGDAQ